MHSRWPWSVGQYCSMWPAVCITWSSASCGITVSSLLSPRILVGQFGGHVFKSSLRQKLFLIWLWLPGQLIPEWIPENVLGSKGGQHDIDNVPFGGPIGLLKHGASTIYPMCLKAYRKVFGVLLIWTFITGWAKLWTVSGGPCGSG